MAAFFLDAKSNFRDAGCVDDCGCASGLPSWLPSGMR